MILLMVDHQSHSLRIVSWLRLFSPPPMDWVSTAVSSAIQVLQRGIATFRPTGVAVNFHARQDQSPPYDRPPRGGESATTRWATLDRHHDGRRP